MKNIFEYHAWFCPNIFNRKGEGWCAHDETHPVYITFTILQYISSYVICDSAVVESLRVFVRMYIFTLQSALTHSSGLNLKVGKYLTNVFPSLVFPFFFFVS